MTGNRNIKSKLAKKNSRTLKKKSKSLAGQAKTAAKNSAKRIAKRTKVADKAVKKAAKKPTTYNKMKAKSAVAHARKSSASNRRMKF